MLSDFILPFIIFAMGIATGLMFMDAKRRFEQIELRRLLLQKGTTNKEIQDALATAKQSMFS